MSRSHLHRAQLDQVKVVESHWAGGTAVHPLGTERLSLTPAAGAPVVLVKVRVVSCEDPGEKVWSPGGVAVADAGARPSCSHLVVGGDDVGLHQLVGGVGGEGAGSGHRAFVEGALRAVAVVAAIAQQYGSLLAHGVVGGVDARSAEHDRKGAALRIASHGGPVMWLALGHRGDESPGDIRQVRAEFGAIRVDAADQVVLLVGHDPRAGRVAVIPAGGVAEVGGLHGAVVVVAAVDLGVAVVEATAGIEVPAVDNPVLSFRLIVDGSALGVVHAQAHAGSMNTP